MPPAFAKLYSQHTRLDAGQPGLRWRPDESESRIEDAIRLVDAAFVQRSADDPSWFEPMLRAAELLEWLSHPTLNPDAIPIHLLAAAAYQLAGYPARSAGLLSRAPESPIKSGPLVPLLRGDFPSLLRTLVRHWTGGTRQPGGVPLINWADETRSVAQLRRLIEDETTSALGILCGTMRWGSDDRVDTALEKLAAVAKLMLNGRDRYSWLLAKLVAETCRTFVSTSLRRNLDWLPGVVDPSGALAVERYLRQAYDSCKTQAWPSQARGIARLAKNDSFVLCTPTGSGKTTVAEIAILQSLFSTSQALNVNGIAPLAMYLVPSRALAAEVESKLSRVIAPLSQERIVITGLYGGIDWGPTDAWLTAEEKTVLICTYEKAEALLRFLGPLFLARLSLVVLDEAHTIEFDGELNDLQSAESRALRLESLVARLLVHIPPHQSRIIALSAVAAGMETTLARWITADPSATPERTLYRSTRQLIGRLECMPGRAFEIRYDLLDRARLRFEDLGSPFIPHPFPPHPPAPSFAKGGAEKRLRPYLFWAAMHLVAPSGERGLHAVLISIPQQIGGYAQDLLDLLEGEWAELQTPEVFRPPTDTKSLDLWHRCLRACQDYFGTQSREFRLLQKGIVVHHGKMPGLMARLLVQLVDDGIVHLILATSTLSEGVNLPFETVLLPTLRRQQQSMTGREFANLAGRAGRPGHGTEGRCLVLLPHEPTDYSGKTARERYDEVIRQLDTSQQSGRVPMAGNSALAALIQALARQWMVISNSTKEADFLKWLEETATTDTADAEVSNTATDLTRTLDSLDGILLASIVEIESLSGASLSPTETEAKLLGVWRRCYAHYASADEAMLGRWFLRRGHALVATIYPDPAHRRRLYRTGLPPRLGTLLTKLYPLVRQHLETGADYAARTADAQFEFIKKLVDLLAAHPKFAPAAKTPGNEPWHTILRWWMDPAGPIAPPRPTQVSEWYAYIANNFSYRFAWGVGCILALAANEAHGDVLQPTTLESWPTTGLPWIALWLKDLIVWGTLDPVAAYLLGRGRAGTRVEARDEAAQYYALHAHLTPNELLDPTTVRKWAETLPRAVRPSGRPQPPGPIKVTLARSFPTAAPRLWRVLPVQNDDQITWVDPAGFALASSPRPSNLAPALLDHGDFHLNVDDTVVTCFPYL